MAVLNQSMQETFKDMDFCRLSVRLLREGVDIVQKANIALTLPDFQLETIERFPKGLSSLAEGVNYAIRDYQSVDSPPPGTNTN